MNWEDKFYFYIICVMVEGNMSDDLVRNDWAENNFSWKWTVIIVIVIIVLMLPVILNWFKKYQYNQDKEVLNNYYDRIIDDYWTMEENDRLEILNSLDTIKWHYGKDREEMYDELQRLSKGYTRKFWSLGHVVVIYSDFKDVDNVKEVISNCKLFKQYLNEQVNDYEKLFEKYKNLLTNPDLIENMISEAKKYRDVVVPWMDESIEYYEFMLTVQDEFYIGSNWAVYFYEDWENKEKFEKYKDEWNKGADEFEIAYNRYSEFAVESAKSLKEKLNN